VQVCDLQQIEVVRVEVEKLLNIDDKAVVTLCAGDGVLHDGATIASCKLATGSQLTACIQAIDETGLDSKDVDLVIKHVSCRRSEAVAALRRNSNDIVEAIMDLTDSG